MKKTGLVLQNSKIRSFIMKNNIIGYLIFSAGYFTLESILTGGLISLFTDPKNAANFFISAVGLYTVGLIAASLAFCYKSSLEPEPPLFGISLVVAGMVILMCLVASGFICMAKHQNYAIEYFVSSLFFFIGSIVCYSISQVI